MHCGRWVFQCRGIEKPSGMSRAKINGRNQKGQAMEQIKDDSQSENETLT